MITTREQALVEARRAVDAARARRDALPIREAARQAAAGSLRTPDEVELILRRLHRAAPAPAPAAPAAEAA
ncbi:MULTISPECIES: hypothetical protein [unclassified Streptomyces]|uniref:hypothetical protein n=1 Tax=unclassified Streptomyces TaxID=2593676 RepID=UPI00381327F3